MRRQRAKDDRADRGAQKRPLYSPIDNRRSADARVDRGTLRATVIIGAHVIIFTTDADGVRSFLHDTLGLSSVDAGGG
jgi:hypothetical protein